MAVTASATASSTASTSLPSTSTLGTPRASARAAAPGPEVISAVRVVEANPLSSHTNNAGSLNTPAQFRPSRNGPRLIAPSPKIEHAIRSSPRSLIAWAAPAQMWILADTTPFAPSMPTEKSAMCMEPPLPWLVPPSRPSSSRIMAVAFAPFASV